MGVGVGGEVGVGVGVGVGQVPFGEQVPPMQELQGEQLLTSQT